MSPLQEPLHRHETVLESYTVNGAQADLVAWEESLWCGKQRYAADNVNEPDIEKLMEEFMALGALPQPAGGGLGRMHELQLPLQPAAQRGVLRFSGREPGPAPGL